MLTARKPLLRKIAIQNLHLTIDRPWSLFIERYYTSITIFS
jgi:hypothetical protein